MAQFFAASRRASRSWRRETAHFAGAAWVSRARGRLWGDHIRGGFRGPSPARTARITADPGDSGGSEVPPVPRKPRPVHHPGTE